MRMGIMGALALVWVMQVGAAENCESLIALSKVTSKTTESRSDLETHAAKFCSLYESYKKSGSTQEIGISYEALSGSYGETKMSYEQVAAKYCSASDSRKVHDSAYARYVESIAPGAYPAYETCKKMAMAGEMDFTLADHSDSEALIRVEFTPKGSDTDADLEYSVSRDVKCAWTGGTKKNPTKKSGPGGLLLRCERELTNIQHSIGIARTDRAGESFSLKWPPSDGPRDRLADLASRIATLEAPPRDGRVYFIAGTSCPPGYTVYEALLGRVARGVRAGEVGTIGGSDTVTLTAANMPPHRHDVPARGTNADTAPPYSLAAADYGTPGHRRETLDGPGTSAPVVTIPAFVGLLPCVSH